MLFNALKLLQKINVGILLPNFKLKNENLAFDLNFSRWGAGETQFAVLKSKIDSSGEPTAKKAELFGACYMQPKHTN